MHLYASLKKLNPFVKSCQNITERCGAGREREMASKAAIAQVPKWTSDTHLSKHLAKCQEWITNYDRPQKLEVAESLRLDSSWRSAPKTLRSLGRRRSVICDIDTVECVGCNALVHAKECYEATSNPFSTARCMLVCSSCRDILNDDERKQMECD